MNKNKKVFCKFKRPVWQTSKYTKQIAHNTGN